MCVVCNKINTYINKMIICLFSIYRIIINKIIRGESSSKEIIVIITGHIGDSLLFLDCMQALREYYSSKDGYHIRFIANKSNIELYQKYGGYELDEYMLLDTWNREQAIKFSSFYKLYRYLSMYKPEKIIALQSLWEGVCLLVSLKSNESYYLKKEQKCRESKIIYKILKLSCSNIVFWKNGEMAFSAQKRLLHKIGMTDYKSRIGRLSGVRSLDKGIKFIIGESADYCVVVPGAQDKARRWEVEKFTKIISYILCTYNLSVILSGAEDEEKIGKVIKSHFNEEKRVINLIGKTSFDVLFSIISESKFVFGNDTGTIHIAASLGIPSLCLMTYKDKGFHPYVLDIVRSDDYVPRGIWAKQTPYCADCLIASSMQRHKIVCKNMHCVDDIFDGKPFNCLSEIRVEDVKKEINLLAKEIGLQIF